MTTIEDDINIINAYAAAMNTKIKYGVIARGRSKPWGHEVWGEPDGLFDTWPAAIAAAIAMADGKDQYKGTPVAIYKFDTETNIIKQLYDYRELQEEMKYVRYNTAVAQRRGLRWEPAIGVRENLEEE